MYRFKRYVITIILALVLALTGAGGALALQEPETVSANAPYYGVWWNTGYYLQSHSEWRCDYIGGTLWRYERWHDDWYRYVSDTYGWYFDHYHYYIKKAWHPNGWVCA